MSGQGESFEARRRRVVADACRALARELVSKPQGRRSGTATPAVSPAQLTELAAAVEGGEGRQEASALLEMLPPVTAASQDVSYRLYWRVRDAAEMSAAKEPPSSGGLPSAADSMLALKQQIASVSRSFVRTTPFARIPTEGGEFEIQIKDLLLLGAIAHADVLLVGRTGSGKSRLASMVMKALFGPDGYYAKTVLPSMSTGDFLDLDLDKMRKGEGRLSEAKLATAALTRPGLIVNEANRAPGLVQAILIPLLDREFELEGKPVTVGVSTDDGEQYQYRILTVNEGEDYHVEPFDAALRDRSVLQVPMDVFPQSERDIRSMIEEVTSPGGPVSSTPALPDGVKHVTSVLRSVRAVPLDGAVIPFLTYLTGLANCVRSPTGFKEGVTLVPSQHCAGCHHEATFDGQNLCGHVRGPSPRALVNLLRIAQACALLRSVVSESAAVATVDDVHAVAPFVLRGKLGLDRRWLEDNGPRGPGTLGFAGNEWVAVRSIVGDMRNCFERFVASDAFWIVDRLSRGEDVPADARSHLQWYIEDGHDGVGDNWCFNRVRLITG